MPPDQTADISRDLGAEFHLLGSLDFDSYLGLQRRLVYEAASSNRRRITVILCEHNPLITIGRRGSRADIRLTDEQLRQRRLDVRWVNRSGGCILHGPGQLAVYPVVPLALLDWNRHEFVRSFQLGLRRVMDDMGISSRAETNQLGIWGRSGLLAAIGISVRAGVSCFGAAVNVNPPMSHYGYIDTATVDETLARGRRTMSCLLAERRLPARMTMVRASIVSKLAATFSCPQHNIHSGHPWLRRPSGSTCEPITHAS